MPLSIGSSVKNSSESDLDGQSITEKISSGVTSLLPPTKLNTDFSETFKMPSAALPQTDMGSAVKNIKDREDELSHDRKNLDLQRQKQEQQAKNIASSYTKSIEDFQSKITEAEKIKARMDLFAPSPDGAGNPAEYEKYKAALQEIVPQVEAKAGTVNAFKDVYGNHLKSLDKTNERLNALLPPKETSLIEGAVKSANHGMADTYRAMDGTATFIGKLSGGKLSHGGFFNDVANWMDEGAKDLKDLPDNYVGHVIGGLAQTAPLIAETVLAPEISIPQKLSAATGGLVKTVPKFGLVMAFNKGGSAMQINPEDALSETAKGFLEGSVMSGLGYAGGKTGELAKSLGAGEIAAEAASAAGTGTAFTGYDALMGERDPKKLAESFGMGIAFELPKIASSVYKVASDNFNSTSPDAIKQANNINMSVEELRNKAANLYEDLKTETDDTKKRSIALAAESTMKIADLKAITKDVMDNPAAKINEINNDPNLTPEEKNYFVNHVRQVITGELADKKVEELNKKKADLQESISDQNLPDGEAKRALIEDVSRIDQEINSRNKTVVDDYVKESELSNRITGLEEALNKIDANKNPESAKSIEKLITETKDQLEILKPKKDASIQIEEPDEIPVQSEAGSSEGVRGENKELQNVTGESEVKSTEEVREENGKEKIIEVKAPEITITKEPVEPEPINPIQGTKVKLRALEKRIENSSIPDEVKQGMKAKGVGYVPEKVDLNETQAKELIGIYNEEGKVDELAAKVMNQTNEIKSSTRGALTAKLGEHYMKKADEARDSGDLKSHQEYRDKMIEVADFAAKAFTEAGQFTAIGGMLWKKMCGKYPDLVIEQLKKKLKVDRDRAFEGKEKDLKSTKDFIDEFMKSEEFEKIVSEKVKNELSKLAEKSTKNKKDNIFTSKEVREKRKEELREKWKTASKSSASSSIIGLNTAQIEVIGEMGAIYLAEGAHVFAKWAKKMAKEFEGITEDQLAHIWRNVRLPKELDEKERTLKDFASVGRYEKMSAEEKNILLDKLSERLKGMSEEKKKQFLSDVIDEVDKLGGLSDERFKELYAKAMGMPHLTEEAKQHIYELSKKISEADKLADEYIKLYEKGGSVKELKDLGKKMSMVEEEARYANDKLSDYFKKNKTLGDVFSANVQGGLMTPITAITNIIGNASKAGIIAPLSRAIASGLDFALSKAAKLPLLKKLLSEARTINAIQYWKGAANEVPNAISRAARGVIKGSTADDFTIRDTHTKIEPIKAWKNIVDQIKGDKQRKLYDFARNLLEGTGGFAAEGLFRVLNFGDKIFTLPAVEGLKSEMASNMGLKGSKKEKFMKLTPVEFQEVINQRSSEYTFQQDSNAAQAALKIKKLIFDNLPEKTPQIIKDAWKSFGNLQIPFIKTPVNVIAYVSQLAIPELALLKSVYEGAKGDRRKSLESLGLGMTGLALRSVFNNAASNNLLTPMISDDDTKSEKAFKIGGADVKPGQVNITALKRMLSGGDPTPQADDHWINYKYFGLFGIQMNLAAKNKDYYKDPEMGEIEKWGNMVLGSAKELPKTVLEQTFLSGLNTLLDAITSPSKFAQWGTNTTVASSTAIIPNTIAQISKSSLPDMKDVRVDQGTRWEKFKGSLKNTFKERMFMGESLPSRITIWGDKASRLPEGADPSYKYMYGLFDMYKPNKVDPNSFEYRLYKTYDDAPESEKAKLLPSQPARGKITIDGQKVPINEKDYENLSVYIGKARKDLAEEYILSDAFDEDDVKTKIKKLKSIYIDGRDLGKQSFLDDNPQVEDLADVANEDN